MPTNVGASKPMARTFSIQNKSKGKKLGYKSLRFELYLAIKNARLIYLIYVKAAICNRHLLLTSHHQTPNITSLFPVFKMY